MVSTAVRRNSNNSLETSSPACLSDCQITSMQLLMQTPKVILTEKDQKKLDGGISLFNGSTDHTIALRELDSKSKQLVLDTGSDKIKAIRLLGSIIKEYQDKYKDLAVQSLQPDAKDRDKIAEEAQYCKDVCVYVWDAIGDMIFFMKPGTPFFDSDVPLITEMEEWAPSEAFIVRAYIRGMEMDISDPHTHGFISKLLWCYALPETKRIYLNLISKYEAILAFNPNFDSDIKGIKRSFGYLCEEIEQGRSPVLDPNNLALL